MKTAIYIENGYAQIVLTPENNFEKDLLKDMKLGEVVLKKGSFYHCQGDYVRQSSDDSIFITIEQKD